MTRVAEKDMWHTLYDDVTSHLNACVRDDAQLSDHWRHTLDQRGRAHGVDEMIAMLAADNPVNARIRDTAYLVDGSLIDSNDPVQKQLLANGEPDFGNPEKDFTISGAMYSSAFINTVPLTARIIREINSLSKPKPTVFEIGGGLGGLAYQMLAYFDRTIRLIAVDIPEILIVQEWYLRNCLPHLNTAFIADTASLIPDDADVIFINAHVLQGRDLDLDFAININSFQDMSADIANGYIRYVEAHISDGGIFHIQNTTGQSASSVDEPSCYDFDACWTAQEIGIAEAIETCLPGTELRLILKRSTIPEDAAMRRGIFDFCWHSMNAGKNWSDSSLVDEMRGWPARHQGTSLDDIISGTALLNDWQLYLENPSQAFTDPEAVALSHAARTSEPRSMNNIFRYAQSSLIAKMRSVIDDGPAVDVTEVTNYVNELCIDVDARCTSAGASRSEYWTGYLASFLCGLGKNDMASATLEKAVRNATTLPWRMRFAKLAIMAGNQDLSRAILKTSPDTGAGGRTAYLDQLDICCQLGDAMAAMPALLDAIDGPNASPAQLQQIALSLSIIGDDAGVFRAFNRLISMKTQDATRKSLDLVRMLGAGDLADLSRQLWDASAYIRNHGTGDLAISISSAHAGWYAGDRVRAIDDLAQAREQAWDSYYDLGRLGAIYISLGDIVSGDKCLLRSIDLKPDNFMHYEFIGGVYLSHGYFDKAHGYFKQVQEMKPYLRHILARVAFCALPSHIRDNGVFGQASGLGMIYQQSQSYYG